MKINHIVVLIASSLLGIVPLCLIAQKLPNIQNVGVWLPENVKIDGKLNEWRDILRAYNKSNRLQYTLANNDKYLYLAIKSTDKATIGKIMAGGVNLTVKFPDEKQKPTLGIMYPLTNVKYKSNVYAYMDSTKVPDIILMAKEMKVFNLKAIPDSLISIYNSYGIKISISYSKQILIYELLLPLNVLDIPYSEGLKFNYNIKLEGTLLSEEANNLPNSPPPPPVGLPSNRSPTSTAGLAYEMRTPTDFSGKYALYKK